MKLQRPPRTKIQFIEPMYARLVNELPEGEDWLYEVKFDGYRCLAARDDSGVIDGAFVLQVSDNLDLASAAPLLCVGITRYSPLCHWKVSKRKKVDVVGFLMERRQLAGSSIGGI